MMAILERHNPPTVWAVGPGFQPIYSHALEASGASRLLFVSGQFGVRPDGTLPENFGEQCRQAMDNVEALLASAGLSRRDIVKVTYLLTQASDQPELASIRRERWSGEPPAVTAFVVTALACPEYLIEIEVTAAS